MIIDNLNIAVSRVGETIFRNGMVEIKILLNPISLPLQQFRVKTLARSHFHDRENRLGTVNYFCVVLVAQYTGLSKLIYSYLRARYGLVTQFRLA